MQALTPDQTKWLQDTGWEITRSGIVALCAWGLHRLRKSVKSIIPGIVEEVNKHSDARMAAHEKKDDERFRDLTDKVETATAHLSNRRHPATGD